MGIKQDVWLGHCRSCGGCNRVASLEDLSRSIGTATIVNTCYRGALMLVDALRERIAEVRVRAAHLFAGYNDKIATAIWVGYGDTGEDTNVEDSYGR